MDKHNNLKIALVHDFLIQAGGAERVLLALSEMFPEAPIYTLLYDEKKMRGMFSGKDIRTSFLQKFPNFLRKKPMYLLPFLAVAPETFDLRDFDLVISSSGAWTKGIVTKLNTIHIAYLHSPMRFVWDYNEKYLREKRKEKLKFLVRPLLSYLRVWDKLAADRPDHLIANSAYTQKRIKKYYGRDSQVIYPPVSLRETLRTGPPVSLRETLRTGPPVNTKHETRNTKHELPNANYFLVVSRLSPYKKTAEVVEAFNKLKYPLVVIGEGAELKKIRKMAEDNVQVLGWQSDEEIQKYYANARAFVFPSWDDFGLAPVEAMNWGVPVLAIRKGGALETVIEGQTGEFFEAATPEVIADAVRRFIDKENQYDREFIKKQAEKFAKETFKKEMGEFIEKIISN